MSASTSAPVAAATDPATTPRVVHVITALPTGGAERQLELIAARGHGARTIALYGGGPVADSMRAAGREVDVLGMAAGWRKPLAWLRLARRLRALRPDVVHTHLLAGQLWGIPAARLARVPVVVSTEHSLVSSTVEGRPHSRSLRIAYRLLERAVTHTVAVSDTTRTRLLHWGVSPQRMSIIPNGIDFEALAYSPAARARVREELGIAPDAVVLGAVARLDAVKRIDEVLLAAAPLLRNRARPCVLVVAGTGPLADPLRQMAERLGVAGSVRWVGARGDVPALLSAMDLLISASQDETYGMAVVEAMGSGLPVVYVEAPALEELAEAPVNARRLPPGDDAATQATALTAAVCELLDRGVRRYPVPAELTARYGIDATAASVNALHRTLTDAARR